MSIILEDVITPEDQARICEFGRVLKGPIDVTWRSKECVCITNQSIIATRDHINSDGVPDLLYYLVQNGGPREEVYTFLKENQGQANQNEDISAYFTRVDINRMIEILSRNDLYSPETLARFEKYAMD